MSLGAPTIGLAAALGVVLLGAVGYFVFTTNAPVRPTISTAALLSAEQLEQALAERRKADAQAADMARREDEARQKAQAEAEAKRQADEALEQTRQARLRAEQELVEVSRRLEVQRRENGDQASRAAGEAAQRKAEQDAAALAEAEQRAAQKAAADAEAKRQADEALAKAEADRQLAEQEARQKADAEQTALRQASEDAQRKAAEAESVKQAEQERLKAEAERAKADAERQKAEAELKLRAEAEAAEKVLRLDQPARERLQLALTSLGFDTRGSDGIFGPRTREMISAWQKARKEPPTGFLTAPQQQSLLKEAAPAMAKLDEAKKAEEDAKARLTTALATAAIATPPSEVRPASAAAPPGSTKYDGEYNGSTNPGIWSSRVFMSLQIANGRGTGTLASAGCSPSPFSLTVSDTGTVKGEADVGCILATITGTVTVFGSMQRDLVFQSSRGGNSFRIVPERGRAAAASMPTSSSPDGLWRGTYNCGPALGIGQAQSFDINFEIRLSGGSGVWRTAPQAIPLGSTVEIRVSVDGTAAMSERFTLSGAGSFGNSGMSTPAKLVGRFDGNTIRTEGRENTSGNRQCELSLRRSQ